MHLVASHLQYRHLRKHLHIFAVARDKTGYSFFTLRTLDAEFAARDHQAGCQTLQVPLEGSANGLVEVVDVENEPPIRRSIRAQVAHMRVAANLVHDSRMR